MKKIYLQIKFAKNKQVKAYILDLSRSGMGMAAVSRLGRGLNIEIAPKIKLLPRLQAKVIYAFKLPRKEYNYRAGVKFINLNQKQLCCLDKFIDKVARRGKDGNRKHP
ncbi:MAG: PilZ domain-containing protein [Candidatus Omnitrophota bacterium]